jgi:sulfur relay protein TusB/DsrH
VIALIILSDYDISKLEIASEMVKKKEDKRVVLLSDALYLLSGSETNEAVNKMLKIGVTFIALETDVKKRGVDTASKHIITTSYEELVKQLLERRVGIVNL